MANTKFDGVELKKVKAMIIEGFGWIECIQGTLEETENNFKYKGQEGTGYIAGDKLIFVHVPEE
jgi:hypothetical protein